VSAVLYQRQPPLLDSARQHVASDKPEAVLADLDRLLSRAPRDTNAWTQKALVLILLARYPAALEAADRALRLAPENPNAHSYRGGALLQLGQLEDALAAYERVIALAPHAAVAHYNRGNALRRLSRWAESLTSLEQALTIQPNYTDALTVSGLAWQALGDRAKALQYFDEALRINPQAADAHYNRALLLLATGHLAEGWQDYAWRLRWEMVIRRGQSRAVSQIAPEWDGGRINGPLLVVPEQGLGDQIFYAGMLVDLQHQLPGSTVCLEPRLIPLMARSFKQLHFISPDQIDESACITERRYAAQVHISSLGQFFRCDASDMARVKPGYLQADGERSAAIRHRLQGMLPAGDRPLICGLSWQSKNDEFGRDKSLSLSSLLPPLSLPGIRFVDLQYGDTSTERAELLAQHQISIYKLNDIDCFHDIDALAALVNACDIVVTVSNTTAHLAAALGKPVIVMLPASPSLFWYWHLDRSDSPWYPSAVLLRQNHPGDWGGVIATASAALAEFTGALQS
jgi:Tfp pilus assembly protein PilF